VSRPPGVVAPLTGSGEGAEPSPATPVQPACLTQRRDNDDPEVGDRAPERGESWIPPLGPEREGGALEAPMFDDTFDDDEPNGPEGDESGRAPSGGQGDDEARAGESAASEEPDPFGDDLLVGVIAPDH